MKVLLVLACVVVAAWAQESLVYKSIDHQGGVYKDSLGNVLDCKDKASTGENVSVKFKTLSHTGPNGQSQTKDYLVDENGCPVLEKDSSISPSEVQSLISQQQGEIPATLQRKQ